MQKLKVGDQVIILAGKDKSKSGKILSINFKTRRVLVDGINKSKKTMKPTQENPSGGIVEIDKPIHISNVALVSPKTNQPTRVRIENRDGKKVRVAIKCGSLLS